MKFRENILKLIIISLMLSFLKAGSITGQDLPENLQEEDEIIDNRNENFDEKDSHKKNLPKPEKGITDGESDDFLAASLKKMNRIILSGELMNNFEALFNWPPPPPSMEKMKKKGCVVDGLLSGYGKESKNIRMVNRSECVYLHRAIETWLEVPDFEEISENMRGLKKDDLIIGMFISEAIDTKEDLYYPYEKRDFDFSEMCREGTKNFWGEHSCIPDLKKEEYQKYVLYITRRAMAMRVQSFMFGQIYHQDDLSDPAVDELIDKMKANAKELGIEIVVGAQTNNITDEEYLQQFDYIEGGVGLYPSGQFEDGPCFSRWWKKPGDWCWGLLWHESYSKKAKNVFIHLDWSGKKGDDMSTFARMNKEKRKETLENLYNHFTSQGHGFLMPFMSALPSNNDGCYGEKERYYSANRKYSCDDEEAINEIFKK